MQMTNWVWGCGVAGFALGLLFFLYPKDANPAKQAARSGRPIDAQVVEKKNDDATKKNTVPPVPNSEVPQSKGPRSVVPEPIAAQGDEQRFRGNAPSKAFVKTEQDHPAK